jgi:hypothetical protein
VDGGLGQPAADSPVVLWDMERQTTVVVGEVVREGQSEEAMRSIGGRTWSRRSGPGRGRERGCGGRE